MTNGRSKFTIVKERLSQDFEGFIRSWFPNGHKDGINWRTGDFHDTPPKDGGGSLSINLIKQYATDFNTGETAKGAFNIFCKKNDITDENEAADILVVELGLQQKVEEAEKQNYNNRNYNTNNTNISNNETTNRNKPLSSEKKKLIDFVLRTSKPYQEGDIVDEYLKSRGIKNYGDNTFIHTNKDGNTAMVNLCKEFVENKPEEIEKTGRLYKRTDSVRGFQYTWLKRDENGKVIREKKIQEGNTGGNPCVFSEKGDNNGFIYVTEGVENAKSIQEHINNEVWAALSKVNFPNLPFEKDQVYVFVLDNDDKGTTTKPLTETLKDKLKILGVKYNIHFEEGTNRALISYNEGEYSLKEILSKLKEKKDRNFFYLIPSIAGADVNDLHTNVTSLRDNSDEIVNGLKDFLERPLKEIEIEKTEGYDKRLKKTIYYRPDKTTDIEGMENDKLSQEFALRGLEYTPKGIAKRVMARYGDQYCYVKGGGGICKYNGKGKYESNEERNINNDIDTTMGLCYYEYDYLTRDSQKRNFKDFYKKMGTNKFTQDVKASFKNLEQLKYAKMDDFDNDNVINTVNGIVNMRTGELEPHSPDRLFFKQLNVKYNKNINPDDRNSDWNKFLISTFCKDGNEKDIEGLKKIHFLQKAMGYTFSTNLSEHKMFLTLGETRSGKSTFLEVIQNVMEDYCADKQSQDFLTMGDQSNNYMLGVIASLKGKRMQFISEIGKDRKLNGTLLKNLVGDECLTGKFLYDRSFSFKNTTHCWVATNNIDFNEFDDSIKTKLHVIRFPNRFYEAGTKEALENPNRVIDKTLKARLLEPHNQEFILRWIVEGFRNYVREGLNPTDDMKKALEDLELDNNDMGVFIKSNLKQIDEEKSQTLEERETVKDLYNLYTDHQINDLRVPENKLMGYVKFTKELRSMGFIVDRLRSKKTGQREYFINGWCLRDEIIIEKQIDNRYTEQQLINRQTTS